MWIIDGKYVQANLGNGKHILNPHADFSACEDSVYGLRPLQKPLSMGLEAFSTPAATHFAIATLGIS